VRRQDKVKVLNWLQAQIEKLELLPHYARIKDRVDMLRQTAQELEAEV